MNFTTTLLQGERKNVTGIVVPDAVVEALGGGRRAPVVVTIKGYSYRSTLAVMGGDVMVGVAAEHRERAGVAGGETLEVGIALDTAPRTVEVPADFAAALEQAGASERFAALAYSHRKEHVRAIEEARSPETRQRRIDKAVEKILAPKA
ncbi:hypothetical protein QO010_003628 [Caulobacter ginsengisoli]|uniref:DUF1905 domain-containing protein n=1 Tax=Caulobacter ginsengisoli TaxID=400775 RepID=A0ABU0IUZ0_9CAUL|nr:YdeI/OmpD-associated family protein [Caulobacter ginsengisoli]MDQ0465836.1 hypothetical protein [Caulobacter ginsengisoli]